MTNDPLVDDAIVDVLINDIQALREEEDPEVWIERAEPLIDIFESMLVAYQAREYGAKGCTILMEGGNA